MEACVDAGPLLEQLNRTKNKTNHRLDSDAPCGASGACRHIRPLLNGVSMGTTENEEWLEEIKHKNIRISKPVANIDELLNIIQNLAIRQRVSREPIIFRGQGNAAQRLIPSAYRHSGRLKIEKLIGENFNKHIERKRKLLQFKYDLNKDKTIPQEDIYRKALNEVQVDFEFQILKEFICEADRQAHPLPEFTTDLKSRLFNGADDNHFIEEWPLPGLYAVIGLAQHIGIPTRFLDWTNDVYAALYFAASSACKNITSNKADNFILWILHTGPYKENLPIHAYRLATVINPPFKTIHVPTTYNTNLAAQQGLFIYCSEIRFENYEVEPKYDLVKVISSLEELETFTPYLEAIRVPVTEACALLGILDTQGHSPSKYFPGLEGVIQTIEMRGIITQNLY